MLQRQDSTMALISGLCKEARACRSSNLGRMLIALEACRVARSCLIAHTLYGRWAVINGCVLQVDL